MVSSSNLVAAPATPNIYLDTLTYDFAYRPGYVISYAFLDQAQWAATGAADAFNQSLAAWQAVANFSTQFVANYTPALRNTTSWVEALGNPSGDNSVLGQHDLPGTNAMEGFFNQNHPLFSVANNVRGGFSYVTFLHEIGHGLGLLHPHDDGLRGPLFPGVVGSGDLGDFRLNQGVYTVMTYNDGSVDVGLSPSNAYGWAYGPMAFDIATIQLLYGANPTTGAGASTYAIPGINAVGTGYMSIWDVSGSDTISAAGVTADATIDLRAATLLREVGGGGWLSRADGIYGGVTIANGVVIENATGGSGRDRLIGNAASNTLDGGAGFDTADYSMATGALTINLRTGAASGTGIGSDTLVSVEQATGGSGGDVMTAFAGATVATAYEIVKSASIVNTTTATAISLNGRFGTAADANITSATTVPHATLRATSSGGIEFYSFTVTAASATVTVDIDATYGTNTFIAVLRSDGSTVTSNNNASRDAGSTSDNDSRITTTLSAGTYTVSVGANGTGGAIAIPVGDVYTLHVSVPGAAVATGTVLRGSVLDGGGGNDTLVSGEGDDTLAGGTGIDKASFAGVAAGVTVNLVTGTATGQGADKLHGIENVAGSALDDLITGDSSDNLIEGSGGNDRLFGGAGNDVVAGGDGGDSLVGEDGNDTLIGGNGGDTLSGGAGDNELFGGAGDDIFVIETTSNSIIEAASEGTDEVRVTVGSFVLPSNIEVLTYTGVAIFTGIGNATDNVITGGANSDQLSGFGGNDTLNDGGGAADTLIGGAGNDIYVVGNRGTSTLETVNDGVDEVRTTFAVYGLQANVENLSAIDNGVHGALVGNGLDNVITGGTGNDDLFGRDGNDTLVGGSGTGNTMLGQSGDDIFVVAAIGDSIIELAGEGTDTVQTALSVFVLRSFVENLTYTGTSNFLGVGADDANTLRGGAGSDFLSGLGGNDILIGGAGADELLGGNQSDRFAYEGGETGVDRIYDFVSSVDKIALRDAAFGQTANIDFIEGAGAQVATSGNSSFLHDITTGMISFDIDGTGSASAIVLAQINGGLSLNAGDFLFY